jgi:DNA repair exonuclease SbcCD nuclease subunit
LKALLVGDLHVQVNNLEETSNLFKLIEKTATEHAVDAIVFLGDIFHTHSVVRQEVVDLLQDNLRRLSKSNAIYILAGNHDGSSPTSTKINAVRQTLSHLVTVIDENSGPLVLGPYGLIGFTHSEDDFKKLLPDAQYLVCHQTFNGATYENGFYAPDGFSVESVSQYKRVIAGHIHSSQSVANITYIGTPRPVSSAEFFQLGSKESKNIFIHYSDSDSLIPVSTLGWVRTQYRAEIVEGQDSSSIVSALKNNNDPLSKIRVTLTGTEEFCKNISKDLESAQNLKIVPNILKTFNSKIDADAGKNTIEQLLHYYVFNIIEEPQNIRESIWLRLQKLVPNLGKTSTC